MIRSHSVGQDVLAFGRELVNKGYTSCWGDVPNPKNHTTFNARTFLQVLPVWSWCAACVVMVRCLACVAVLSRTCLVQH